MTDELNYIENVRQEVAALREAMSHGDSTGTEIKFLADRMAAIEEKLDRVAKQKQATAHNWSGADIQRLAVQAVEPALKAMVKSLVEDDEAVEQRLQTKLSAETASILHAAETGRDVASKSRDAAARFLRSYADLYVA